MVILGLGFFCVCMALLVCVSGDFGQVSGVIVDGGLGGHGASVGLE